MNEGKCLCGAVTWELTVEPFAAYNCHCKMCQKVYGTPFGTYYFVRPDQIRWTSGTDGIIHYRSSHLLTRSSCDFCGSVVPYPSENHDLWVAPAGCHDRGRKTDCNIFVADNAPWHDVTGGLPCHDAYPVEIGFPSVDDKPVDDGPEGVVRGSCLCSAIEFHVMEPIKVVYNCHCCRCRHARAAAHATNGFTSYDGVHFLKGQEHLKSYKVSDARYFTQVFCEVCSSAMPRRDAERKLAVIPMGSLDDDPGVKAVANIFITYKAGWHEITDDLPTFEEGPLG